MIRLCLALLCRAASGNNLNLFLSQEEVKQLLGLEHELFYVKDGLINEVKEIISWAKLPT